MDDIAGLAVPIKLVVFDVDGVLTDGRLFLADSGEEYKAFFVRDGQGMKMLKETGVEIAIITGRRSNVVAERMASLGIKHVFQGVEDKLPAFRALLETLELSAAQAAFVGDDLPDLPPIAAAGLGIAVADAHPLVLEHADWCTTANGGGGAAREVCELLMRAQGTLDDRQHKYLVDLTK